MTDGASADKAGQVVVTDGASADAGSVATVYKDASEALICDASTGDVRRTVSFDGKRQRVAANDIFSRSTGVPLALASGKFLYALELDGIVSDVAQADDNLIVMYSAADLSERCALRVTADGRILADLPQLCDVLPDKTLIFDDGVGNLRRGGFRVAGNKRDIASIVRPEASDAVFNALSDVWETFTGICRAI